MCAPPDFALLLANIHALVAVVRVRMAAADRQGLSLSQSMVNRESRIGEDLIVLARNVTSIDQGLANPVFSTVDCWHQTFLVRSYLE